MANYNHNPTPFTRSYVPIAPAINPALEYNSLHKDFNNYIYDLSILNYNLLNNYCAIYKNLIPAELTKVFEPYEQLLQKNYIDLQNKLQHQFMQAIFSTWTQGFCFKHS